MTARILIRASRACRRADASTSAGSPSILVSSCRAVTKSAVPGHLEVHVAEGVLGSEDVGEGDVAVVDLDQAHGDAADRRLDRHAGVHQRQARCAHRRHRRGPVGGQHLGHQPQGVGELLHRGHHREQGPLGQQAVADLAPLGAAHPAGLAVGVGRHVVVVHVALLLVDADGVEHLIHPGHAEGGDVEHLGLAPLEEARAVGGRDDPHLQPTTGRMSAGPRPSMRTPVVAMRWRTSCLVSDRTAALISFSRPSNSPASSATMAAVASSVAASRSALAVMVVTFSTAVGADLGNPRGHVVAVVDLGHVRRAGG